MQLTKFKLVFLGFFLLISIVYFVNYIKLFISASHIDSSPEASIEQYLRSNTNEYKIINVTLREEKFRERIYILECDCNFRNEEHKDTQKYYVYLLQDIGWVVTKIEMIKNL